MVVHIPGQNITTLYMLTFLDENLTEQETLAAQGQIEHIRLRHGFYHTFRFALKQHIVTASEFHMIASLT
jgi:hypothetical protein